MLCWVGSSLHNILFFNKSYFVFLKLKYSFQKCSQLNLVKCLNYTKKGAPLHEKILILSRYTNPYIENIYNPVKRSL